MKKKQPWMSRVVLLGILVVAIFVLLTSRLFYMQVINDEEYATLSEQNRIRILSIEARRGNIYDANMEELATSKAVFAISLASAEIDDKDAVASKLAAILHDPEITTASIVEILNTHYRQYEPVIIKRIPYDEGLPIITELEEMREELPGVLITEEPMRYYPQGILAGQVLGTVGIISEDEQEELDQYDYLLTDWIGKSGLEKTMENFTYNGKLIGLRGIKGMEQVEVNASHRAVRTISSQEPISGNDMVLSVQANVQKVMEDSLSNVITKLQKRYPKCKAGSAVLINVKTGGIIAMASIPGTDPNDFANGLSSEKAKYYWDENLKPTLNRAIAAAYPPGSTFKMVTAMAALSSGTIEPSFTVNCVPAAWKAPRAKCSHIHGVVDLYEALAGSCNTYFQEVGYRTGVDKIYEMGTELGLGQTTGIQLTGEVSGLLPNEKWKNENFSGWENTWRNYDTFYMSMGQGYNSDTPLQLANYVATIANGGSRMRPYLVDRILSPEGAVVYQAEPETINNVNASAQNFADVRKAMLGVTQSGGTAYSLFANFPIQVGAKTGTAQTGLAGDDKDNDYHGIFVAFAPYDDPEVAFACVVEYGHAGNSSGGIVCRDVFQEYFGLNVEPLPDDLPEAME